MRTLLHVILIGTASLVSGCGDHTAASASGFTPTQGIILLTQGSVADIRAAIREYDGLFREEVPGSFVVEIHPQPDGTTAIVAPGGLPAYDFANLTVWLDAPPSQPQVGGAVVWVESPGDGESYYLEPEAENPWGDTMIGSSHAGRMIRVAVPETGISLAKNRVVYRKRPPIETSPSPVVIVVTLDTNTAFGNPGFVPNEGAN
jgi:hypothetical protein